MIPDEYRTDWRRIPKVIAHPEYRKHESSLVSFMARSLEFRADPEQLLYLQAEMARELVAMQEAQRVYQAELDADGLDDPNIVAVCKQLALAIKGIGDGIAWRSLGYDRAAIHEFVFNPQSGHMHLDAIQEEVAAAAAHVERTQEIVVINDLTNCLRLGDFTSVSGGGAALPHEVKSGRGARKSGRANRQKKKREQVVGFIQSGERVTPRGVEKHLRLKTKPRAHLGELQDVVSRARTSGTAHKRVSDSLAVEVFELHQMADAFARGSVTREKGFHNPFAQAKESGTFHSLEHFDKFVPNVAPYSVFPLRDEDRVGIMTGSIWVWTYFNRGNLVRCLRRRGLDVRVPTDQELKAAPKWRPGEVVGHELDNPIVIGGSSNLLRVSFGRLGRMIYELLDEESFADAVEEELEVLGDDQAFVYSVFEDEAALWD